MSNPAIIYGEPIGKEFFYNLLVDRDSKYLTDFKRYFHFLKKNSDAYKKLSLKEKISIDEPIFDYVDVINDWLQIESDCLFRIYIDRNENLFFGFNVSNPCNGDVICKIVKDWKKFKNLRNKYFDWVAKFDDSAEGPLIFALF